MTHYISWHVIIFLMWKAWLLILWLHKENNAKSLAVTDTGCFLTLPSYHSAVHFMNEPFKIKDSLSGRCLLCGKTQLECLKCNFRLTTGVRGSLVSKKHGVSTVLFCKKKLTFANMLEKKKRVLNPTVLLIRTVTSHRLSVSLTQLSHISHLHFRRAFSHTKFPSSLPLM